MTKVKEWNTKGSKKLIYCFGSGELPIVDTTYLQWAVEALGGDAQHYVSSRNRPVYITSDTGRAIIAPLHRETRDVGLYEDLSRFYELLEIYHNSQSNHDRWAFRSHWEDLFFAVKANAVTGRIHPITARDFQDYLEELVND